MIDNFKVEYDKRRWSKKHYFIFVPHFDFEWKMMDAKDFVRRVRINCYGVLAKPEWPHLYKCKEEGKVIIPRREESEIFETFEECLAHYSPGFSEKWKKQARALLIRRVENFESNIRHSKQFLKNSKDELSKFEELAK